MNPVWIITGKEVRDGEEVQRNVDCREGAGE